MEIDPSIGYLLERRYQRLIEQLTNFAMQAAPRLQDQNSRTTLIEVDIEMPNIIQATDTLLNGHGAEEHLTCLHLIALIAHLEQYLSLRGLWDLKLNWTLALLKPSAQTASHLTHILFNVAGTAYDERGEHKKAIELYELAIKHAPDEVKDAELARIYANVATAYRGLSRLDEAFVYMRRAWEHHKKSGNQREIALALANLAEIHFELGDTEGSLLAAFDALKLSQQIGDLVLQAQFTALTAKHMVARGLLREAIPIYETVIKWLTELEDGPTLAITLLNYAMLRHLLQENTKAMDLLHTSIALFEHYAMSSEFQQAVTLLAKVQSS
jgi:tetratricopeptide (TPR) repeat protein